MNLLEGKRALIFGVANDHSIAWGIAKAMHEQGAELAFSYAVEALERRVTPLAESVGSNFVEKCDVTSDEEIEAVFKKATDELAGADALSGPGHQGEPSAHARRWIDGDTDLLRLRKGLSELQRHGDRQIRA